MDRTAETIDQLLMQGRALDARSAALEGWGPVQSWREPVRRLQGGRLVGALGGRRVGDVWHRRAWEDRERDPSAWVFHLEAVTAIDGPLAAWRWYRANDEGPEDPRWRARWLCQVACIAANFRDFERSRALLAGAEALAPGDPWIAIDRADVAQRADRPEEALAILDELGSSHPDYPAGVGFLARVLLESGRRDEAFALLQERAPRLQNGSLHYALLTHQYDRGLHTEALATLDLLDAHWPLADRSTRLAIARPRPGLLYLLGDLDGAIAALDDLEALDPKCPDRARFEAARAAGRGPEGRVILDVPYVRQDHATCGPATLTALSMALDAPVEQLDVVEEICWGGTPAASERRWAEERGHCVREFRVDWPSLTALLDAGIPFALNTVEPQSAHLQAVIGYDPVWRTVEVRDSGLPFRVSYDFDDMEKRYGPRGPRGLAFVPESRRAELEGLSLTDAVLFDAIHDIQIALREHRRNAAAEARERLGEIAPGHWMVSEADLVLSSYDGDLPRQLEAYEKLLEHWPEDLSRRLHHHHLAQRTMPLERWIAMVRDGIKDRESRLVLGGLLADVLIDAEPTRAEARALLRRVLRFQWAAPAPLRTLRALALQEARLEEAYELASFVCFLEPTSEQDLEVLLRIARWLGRIEELRELLERRVEKAGKVSWEPAETLARTLVELGEPDLAVETLEAVMPHHAQDGRLLLAHVRLLRRVARIEEARSRLVQVIESSDLPESETHRLQAELATEAGHMEEALDHWRAVLRTQPLAMDAHEGYARVLEGTRGEEAARRHIEDTIQRFPHHAGLRHMLLAHTRTAGAEERIAMIEGLLAVSPRDDWAMRELALCHADAGRDEVALATLEQARLLDPHAFGYTTVAGSILTGVGRHEDAAEIYAEGLERHGYGHGQLVYAALVSEPEVERRTELCRTIGKRLDRALSSGEGVRAWVSVAKALLPRSEVEATLRRVREERPDLIEPHEELARFLLDETNREEEVLALVAQARERHPLDADLPAFEAHAARRLGDLDRELLAREEAVRIEPGSSRAVRDLSRALEERDDLEGVRRILMDGVASNPRDPALRVALATYEQAHGSPETVARIFEKALEVLPTAEDLWFSFAEWARGERGELPRLAAALDRTRDRLPDSAAVWLAWARHAPPPHSTEERLEAIDRAIELAPRSSDAHDVRMQILVDLGRAEEALQVPLDERWDGSPPIYLEGRAAWVRASRGEIEEAIDAWTGLLVRDPGYDWAWHRTLEWMPRLEDPERLAEIAARMVELRPSDPDALNSLGRSLQDQGEEEEALARFHEAIRANPHHVTVTASAFDLHLARGETESAGRLLEAIRPMLWPWFACIWDLELHCTAGEREGAVAAFRLAVADARVNLGTLRNASTWLARSGWSADMRAVLEEAVAAPGPVSPSTAELLTEELVRAGQWDRCAELGRQLATDAPAFTAVARELLDACGRHRRTEVLDTFCEEHEVQLRADEATWSLVAFALLCQRRLEEVVAWTSDWQDRAQTSPWGLLNLTSALRALDRDAEAAEVSRLALKHGLGDESTAVHAADLAFDAALGGAFDEARSLLAGFDPRLLQSRASARSVLAGSRMLVAIHDGTFDRKVAVGEIEAWPEPSADGEDSWPRRRRLLLQAIGDALGTTDAQVWTRALLMDAEDGEELFGSLLATAMQEGPLERSTWSALARWSEAHGRTEQLQIALRDAVKKDVMGVGVRIALARHLPGPEHVAERIGAARHAVQIAPEDEEARLVLMHAACDANDLDLARRAALEMPDDEVARARLASALADREARSGAIAEAVGRWTGMLAADLLGEHPRERLLHWFTLWPDAEARRLAAARLVAVDGRNAIWHVLVAEAALATGDQDGAQVAFERALAIERRNRRAAEGLFRLLLERRDAARAREVLEHALAPSLEASEVDPLWLRAHAAAGDGEQVRQVLEGMLEDAQHDVEVLDEAMTTASPLLGAKPVRAMLRAAAGDGRCSEAVARLELRCRFTRDKKPASAQEFADRVLSFVAPDGPAREAYRRSIHAEVVHGFGQGGQNARLENWMAVHDAELRAHDWTWGLVGQALEDLGNPDRILRWMADHEQREDVTTWSVIPLVFALHELGHHATARPISLRATRLSESGRDRTLHVLLLALDGALNGDEETVSYWLSLLETQHVDNLQRRAMRALIEAARPGGSAATFEQRRHHFVEARNKALHRREWKRWRRAACVRIAREVGTPQARLWAWWRRLLA